MPSKSGATNLSLFPNDEYEAENNFQGEPCPTKEAIKVIGNNTLFQIDKILKDANNDRKKRCGSGASLTGIASSQIIHDNEKSQDYFCFNGLMLNEENYAFPEKIKQENYTVMLISEFLKKEINEVLIRRSYSLDASRRQVWLERLKLKKILRNK